MQRITRVFSKCPKPSFVPLHRTLSTTPTLLKEALQDSKNEIIPGFIRGDGEIATNYELATGAERYEYLAQLAGKDPWEDMHPIYLTNGKPTVKNPVVIKGVDAVRYIGCTGYPADTHEPIWLTIHPKINNRCPHCGNVFKYEMEADH